MKVVSIAVLDKVKYLVSAFLKSSKSLSPSSADTGKTDNQTGFTASERSQFQRKAHIGNFFAGPHCVFNPSLLD